MGYEELLKLNGMPLRQDMLSNTLLHGCLSD